MSAAVEGRGLSFVAGGTRILTDVTLGARAGELLAVVGPNGSGKSTLLRLLAGLRRPAGGEVRLAGRPLPLWSLRERARRLSFVEQEALGRPDLRVADVVALGLLPHRPPWGAPEAGDAAEVAAALARVGLSGLAHRSMDGLSGGERRRVLLARALAQRTDVVVLDEPTNHLDVRHQHLLLRAIRAAGRTVVAALHDLDLALEYADAAAVLDRGRLVAHGAPGAVLTAEVLEPVFGVRVTAVHHPVTGRRRLLLDPR